MAMRWRCPPENSCGYLPKASRRQADLVQPDERQAGAIVFGGADAVDAHRLGQDLAHGEARVQAGVGVLENDLDAPAVRPQRRGPQRGEVDAFEQDAAGAGVGQAREHHADGGLAGAGLAHHAQRAALVQREVRRLHGVDDLAPEQAVLQAVGLAQTGHLDQRRALGGDGRALLGAERRGCSRCRRSPAGGAGACPAGAGRPAARGCRHRAAR